MADGALVEIWNFIRVIFLAHTALANAPMRWNCAFFLMYVAPPVDFYYEKYSGSSSLNTLIFLPFYADYAIKLKMSPPMPQWRLAPQNRGVDCLSLSLLYSIWPLSLLRHIRDFVFRKLYFIKVYLFFRLLCFVSVLSFCLAFCAPAITVFSSFCS